jgi:Fe-S-cluster containining protein
MHIKKEGFDYAFDPNACKGCAGNCCIGESGYIWVNPYEIKKIADFLGVEEERFKKDYLKKVKYRYSIKEVYKEGSFECLFFDKEGGGCSIYEVRPSQCASYPFWEYFKSNFKEVYEECPGIVTL